MNKVVIYVEGPSDKLAMEALLRPLLDRLRERGTGVDFFEIGSGDRKQHLLLKVPEKAANILLNDDRALVAPLPDLYPKNKGFAHASPEELEQGLRRLFQAALARKGGDGRAAIADRFKVFCFKHDLEALLLAAPELLSARLGVKHQKPAWRVPVEDQNHDLPPKRIVENLFRQAGRRYQDTVDAPRILGACDYRQLASACPQCFAPFVRFLESLTAE